jgi:2-dehydro-3-deoxygluconokinase
MRVTAIGECMIELSYRQDAWQLSFAGDTFNTLWMMKGCLGESLFADFFSGFGSDPFSRQQISFLQMGGIGIASSRTDLTFAPEIYGISLSETGERSFTYWREASAARRLADDRAALAAACHQRDLIYSSGITLAILAPVGRETLFSALADAREGGATIIFDPNYRPRLWRDTEAAREVITEGLLNADTALPTFDDERVLFGDGTPLDTLTRLARIGVPEVVVKDGPAGCVVGGCAAPAAQGVPALKGVAVLDTTGAGDAFNGAYLAARMMGRDCAASARLGHALAAETVGVKGALLPMSQIAETFLALDL